jgi:hypothetical protein
MFLKIFVGCQALTAKAAVAVPKFLMVRFLGPGKNRTM